MALIFCALKYSRVSINVINTCITDSVKTIMQFFCSKMSRSRISNKGLLMSPFFTQLQLVFAKWLLVLRQLNKDQKWQMLVNVTTSLSDRHFYQYLFKKIYEAGLALEPILPVVPKIPSNTKNWKWQKRLGLLVRLSNFVVFISQWPVITVCQFFYQYLVIFCQYNNLTAEIGIQKW